MGKLAMAVCCASVALGQNVDRVFNLANATTVMSLQEIATTLRSVAQIQQLSVDNGIQTLTVKGTVDQIALAEWLVPRLDVAEAPNQGPQEYRVSGDSDDLMVVYGLVHTKTLPVVQEIVTALRLVADIRKIYTVVAPGIITLRGNASQIALAEFLLSELDQAVQPRQNATVHEFKRAGGTDVTTVVCGLAHTDDSRSIQEITTNLRAVLDITKVFPVFAPKLLAVSGSASQVQMAEWLIPELDRQAANASGNEAHMPGGNDDVVHVFYLSHATSSERMNALLKEMHGTVHVMKAFVRSVPPALVLRGTADQIAMAGRIIELSDRAAPEPPK